jgi:hypothetical protein
LHLKSSESSGKNPEATGEKMLVDVTPHELVANAGKLNNAPIMSMSEM